MRSSKQDILDPQQLAVPAATLGLAIASWAVAVRQMSGTMDMGGETGLGSYSSFGLVWISMMAAMMLPGLAPVLVRTSGRVGAVPRFLASYGAVWAVVGVALYAVYRPHGTVTAGALTIAAGLYELTPLKRRFRCSCRVHVGSGLGYGLACLGACGGLMLVLVAVDVMSVAWMGAIAVVVTTQKLLAPNRAVDVPVACALVALGIVLLIAPSAVPGVAPPM